MGAKSCDGFVPSSRRSPCLDCSSRSFSAASAGPAKPTPGCSAGTRSPLPFSSRARGTITEAWPWSRRSIPCGLHSSITTSSELCFARRNHLGLARRLSLRLIADGNRTLLGIPTDRGLAGDRGRFHRQLPKVCSSFSFQSGVCVRHGNAAMDGPARPSPPSFRLERLFLGRHKVFHFRSWYRDVLAGYIRVMLLDSRSLTRPYIERKGLKAVISGHLKGNRNYTTEIHRVLALEIIHRLFLDNPQRAGFGRAKVPAAISSVQCGIA